MPGSAKVKWEQILRDAGARAEDDLGRLVQYINDEVVPEVRRDGSQALRRAAAEMQKLADRMDARAGRSKPPGGAARP